MHGLYYYFGLDCIFWLVYHAARLRSLCTVAWNIFDKWIIPWGREMDYHLRSTGEPVVFKWKGHGVPVRSKRLWLLSGISLWTGFLKYWNFSDFCRLSEDFFHPPFFSLWKNGRNFWLENWNVELKFDRVCIYPLYWEDIKKKCITLWYRLHLGKELNTIKDMNRKLEGRKSCARINFALICLFPEIVINKLLFKYVEIDRRVKGDFEWLKGW